MSVAMREIYLCTELLLVELSGGVAKTRLHGLKGCRSTGLSLGETSIGSMHGRSLQVWPQDIGTIHAAPALQDSRRGAEL